MVIVTLVDGTTYCIDTDSESKARMIVSDKLKDRLDYRQIQSTDLFEGVRMDTNSRYYNPGDRDYLIPLKCKTGWSYKWSDDRCAEFR